MFHLSTNHFSYDCQKEFIQYSSFSKRKVLALKIKRLRTLNKRLPFSIDKTIVRNRFQLEDPIVIQIDNEVFRIFHTPDSESDADSTAHRLLNYYLNRKGTHIRELDLVNFPTAIHHFLPIRIDHLVVDITMSTYNPDWFSSISNFQTVIFDVLTDTDIHEFEGIRTSLPWEEKFLVAVREIRELHAPISVTYSWIENGGVITEKKEFIWKPKRLNDYPTWRKDYLVLRPVAVYTNPLETRAYSKLVLCETLDLGMKPTATNHRHRCPQAPNSVKISLIQSYFILDKSSNRPFGWPENTYPAADKTRTSNSTWKCEFAEFRMDVSIAWRKAGLDVERHWQTEYPGFFTFRIRDKQCPDVGDQLWMARFILQRFAENQGILISFASPTSKCLNGPRGTLELWLRSREMPDELECTRTLRNMKRAADALNLQRLEVVADLGFQNYIRDTRSSGDSDPYQVITQILEDSKLLDDQDMLLDPLSLWN